MHGPGCPFGKRHSGRGQAPGDMQVNGVVAKIAFSPLMETFEEERAALKTALYTHLNFIDLFK